MAAAVAHPAVTIPGPELSGVEEDWGGCGRRRERYRHPSLGTKLPTLIT